MIREIIQEARKYKASDIVKFLKNEDEWGDLADYVKVVKGNLEVVDTYFYGGDKALKNLKDNWTGNGTYAKMMRDDFGVEFEVVDEFEQAVAHGKYKKLTKDGIVGIILKIKN